MRKPLICCATIFVFIACNNSSSSREAIKDSVPLVSADTAITTTAGVESLYDPTALTAAELKDDSVFADGSIPVSWTNAGFTDAIAVKKFLKTIKYWVANNQKDSMAKVIAYPLRKPVIKNAESFLKNYDTLFNEKVKKALIEQNLSQVFRNTQGAMLGSGELWINETAKGLRIVSINH